jgi:hypothetical protein
VAALQRSFHETLKNVVLWLGNDKTESMALYRHYLYDAYALGKKRGQTYSLGPGNHVGAILLPPVTRDRPHADWKSVAQFNIVSDYARWVGSNLI